MKLFTEYGVFECKNNLNKTPKCVLQSYFKMLGIEIGKRVTKKTLCHFINSYENFKKTYKTSSKRSLIRFLEIETEEERKNRTKGGLIKDSEWNEIEKKCKEIINL